VKNKSAKEWTIYGSELSPFTLKVISLFDYLEIPYRFLPEEGKFFENVRIMIRRQLLIKNLIPLTLPEMTELDEFPLVPFLFGPDGENMYDSTAIGLWLDEHNSRRLTAIEDPALNFAIRLIDEYADEFGLYLVHHWRWKGSARENNAGKRLENGEALSGLFRLL
jgi:glutathione S-transferase